MTENEIRNYKLIYTDINIPDHIIEEKWQVIAPMLPDHSAARKMPAVLPFAAIFVLIMVVILSLAGLLYPERVQTAVAGLSESIEKTFSPKSQIPDAALQKVNNIKKAPTNTPTPAPEKEDNEVKGISTEKNNEGEERRPPNNKNETEQTENTNEEFERGNSSDAKENKTENHGNPQNQNSINGSSGKGKND